jgi:hypothetical protein
MTACLDCRYFPDECDYWEVDGNKGCDDGKVS